MAIDLLSVLRRQTPLSFSGIVTGDESWFLYLYQSDYKFARSRDEMIPRTKAAMSPPKSYVDSFIQRCEAGQPKRTGTWFEIHSRIVYQ
jgi:hypothetical protein